MQIFHWKAQNIEFLVLADSVDVARTEIINHVKAVRWQNMARFDIVLRVLEGAPYYAADAGHVIAIDRNEP